MMEAIVPEWIDYKNAINRGYIQENRVKKKIVEMRIRLFMQPIDSPKNNISRVLFRGQ